MAGPRQALDEDARRGVLRGPDGPRLRGADVPLAPQGHRHLHGSAAAPGCTLAVLAALLVAPASAHAHVRSGVVATSLRAVVFAAPAGVTAHVDRSDLALRLAVAPGRRVVVLGYAGEPFLRLD